MTSLGKKWVCFNCAAKFYDFHKTEALCPKCNANQKDAPIKAKTIKKEKLVLHIDDDFIQEDVNNGIITEDDSLEEDLGIETNRVDGVDPGDLSMDDYDE